MLRAMLRVGRLFAARGREAIPMAVSEREPTLSTFAYSRRRSCRSKSANENHFEFRAESGGCS